MALSQTTNSRSLPRYLIVRLSNYLTVCTSLPLFRPRPLPLALALPRSLALSPALPPQPSRCRSLCLPALPVSHLPSLSYYIQMHIPRCDIIISACVCACARMCVQAWDHVFRRINKQLPLSIYTSIYKCYIYKYYIYI